MSQTNTPATNTPATNPTAPQSPAAKAAGFFSTSYAAARQRFLKAAAAQDLPVDSRVLEQHTGLENETLATDVVRLGPASAKRLLVITAGTHGVEGFCGSAAELALLGDPIVRALLDKLQVAVLLVHAINPYGFSYLSRTTEGNVDLNRNSLDFGKPLPHNPGYDEIHELLVPPEWPPSADNAAALKNYIETRGIKAYQDAVTTGQYSQPAGMFYGGHEKSWSTSLLGALLAQYGEQCDNIGWIDFHTGLGPPGHGEKICVGRGGADELRRARSWWGADVGSPLDGTTVAANVAGPVSETLRDTCPHAVATAIAIEYGTIPLTEMLHMLRADMWLRGHPDAPAAQKSALRSQIRDAFVFDDEVWRGLILGQARVAALQGIYGLSREVG
jgi:hypothetical protein